MHYQIFLQVGRGWEGGLVGPFFLREPAYRRLFCGPRAYGGSASVALIEPTKSRVSIFFLKMLYKMQQYRQRTVD
jgi:hypothetical protein